MALKIGILTLPITDNYGGILQAVALYRLLHSQGHDVVLIYKQTHDKQVLWKKLVKEVLLKMPFHNFKNLKTNDKLKQVKLERKKFHRSFIEKEIFKISEDLYTTKDLEKFVKKESFDAVIVGSDQVWRMAYISHKDYKNFFLDFVDGSKIKKIAYAASFGRDCWEGEGDEEEISKLLKDFTAISTRELSGTQICRDSFKHSNAKHVLDPTILMSKEFYMDEIISKYDVSNISKGGLVTYVLDEAKEKKEIIEFVQKSTDLKSLHHLKGFNNSKLTFTVPEWLTSFAYADTVVTDSFHGMVFSIIFEKNFIVIGNHDRGFDRFISLLSLLGLEDRLVFGIEDMKDKKIDNIDYSGVNKILNENKKISFEFLASNLNDDAKGCE